MKAAKHYSKRTHPMGISLLTWQMDLLKQLAIESDRNLSSMTRRVLSAGLIYMGHEEIVRKHDPIYKQTPSALAKETASSSNE